MNAYHLAHATAGILGTIPEWEAQLLDDTAPGNTLVSDDNGDTWRRARAETDSLSGAALALQHGHAGAMIRMASQGGGIIQMVAPSYRDFGLLEHAADQLRQCLKDGG